MPCTFYKVGTLAVFSFACSLGVIGTTDSADAAEALATRGSDNEVCCQLARTGTKKFTTRAFCKARRGKIVPARQCRKARRPDRRVLTPRTRTPGPRPGRPDTDRSFKGRSAGPGSVPGQMPGTFVGKSNTAKIVVEMPALVSNAFLNYGGWQRPCTDHEAPGKTCYFHTVKPGDDRVPVEVSASCPGGSWIKKITVGNSQYHDVITIRPSGQRMQFKKNLKVVRKDAMTFYKNVCRRAYKDPGTDPDVPKVEKKSIKINYHKKYGYYPHRMMACVVCDGYDAHKDPLHGVPPGELCDAVADVHANEVITCHSDYWR